MFCLRMLSTQSNARAAAGLQLPSTSEWNDGGYDAWSEPLYHCSPCCSWRHGGELWL